MPSRHEDRPTAYLSPGVRIKTDPAGSPLEVPGKLDLVEVVGPERVELAHSGEPFPADLHLIQSCIYLAINLSGILIPFSL